MQVSATLSNKDFVINMINLCIGMGLLAKPYAIYVAGWYSIISVILAFSFISYASYIFAKATMRSYGIDMNDKSIVYEMVNITSNTDMTELSDIDHTDSEITMESQQEFVDDTIEPKSKQSVFHVLAEESLGKYGKYYVSMAMTVLLTMVCINVIIIQFDLISQVVNYSFHINDDIQFYFQEKFIFLYIFLAALPLVFILKWKELTIIGIISVISVVILVSTMLYIFILSNIKFENGYVPQTYFEQTDSSNIRNTAQYARDGMNVVQRTFFSFLIFKTGIAGSFICISYYQLIICFVCE